jgi:hypothetical protein
MKVEKKLLMIITFLGALVVLLLIFYLTTGFQSGIKDLIGSVYFSLWVTAVMGLWLYIIDPYLKERPKKKDKKGTGSEPVKTAPVQSPRSNLPLRDRIREYVAERRKEEGLPVPEPLRPSRSSTSSGAGSSSGSSTGYVPVAAAATAGAAVAGAGAAVSAGDSDLPLPDDFDESGAADLFGDEYPEDEEGEASLPGIEDDDFGSFDEPGVDEQPVTESGDLPDFEGDLEPDVSDSGFGDSIEDDLSGKDEGSESEQSGGLSDEGLSDFDMPLDESMMDDDLSGDGDLTDIEFEDLEPDEV